MSKRSKTRLTSCAMSSLRALPKTSPRPTRRGSITVSVRPLLDYFDLCMFINVVRLQGSYAGARAAHMRVLYPDIVFGAIASSGASRVPRPLHIRLIRNRAPFQAVTHATLTNWEYMDVIRLAADPKCSSNLVNSITTIDRLLKFGTLRVPLKRLFGLAGLASDQDFVSVLTVRPPPVLILRNWWRSGMGVSSIIPFRYENNSIRWGCGKIGIGTPQLARRHLTISALR